MPPLRKQRPRTTKERRAANACRMQRSRKSYSSTSNQFREYNIARYFTETIIFERHIFNTVCKCSYCGARLFETETQGTCCEYGKIKLTSASDAMVFKNLFTKNDNIGRDFRNIIRAYNSIFAFTSMGVKLDEQLAKGKNGIYTFRVQGGIYHSIGSLFPHDEISKFFQLYIYDTEFETTNRLSIMPELRQDTLEFIKTQLNYLNPFVTNFRSISSTNNITDLHLFIKADHGLDNVSTTHQPLHKLPLYG